MYILPSGTYRYRSYFLLLKNDKEEKVGEIWEKITKIFKIGSQITKYIV